MKTEFRGSFTRDLKRLKDRAVFGQVKAAIEEVEQAATLQEVSRLKRLAGSGGNYYRIRVGDYRLGLVFENDMAIFVRCLNRKEIYRFFP
ncbi:MAG TPA: type II toxin-antitoxin system RelE/ParE family toxin [Pyrinomonadaceae bacterium]